MKPRLLLVGFLVACPFAYVASRYLHEQWIVDRCLSAAHGSFDYSTMSCDLESNHSYVPYGLRHPFDKRVAEVTSVSLAVIVSAYVYVNSRRRRDQT
jgi:hypothetical protein